MVQNKQQPAQTTVIRKLPPMCMSCKYRQGCPTMPGNLALCRKIKGL